MKKIISILTIVVLVAGLTGLSFAEDSAKAKGAMPDHKMTGDKHMMYKKMGMCPMHCMMMKKTMIATQDGGVAVMAGNSLSKYDKDLNLIKEVELKMDTEGMKKMMDECPMRREMMERCKKMGETKEETKENKAAGKTTP